MKPTGMLYETWKYIIINIGIVKSIKLHCIQNGNMAQSVRYVLLIFLSTFPLYIHFTGPIGHIINMFI